MPRVGRVVLPDYPHHIVQRGHNRDKKKGTDLFTPTPSEKVYDLKVSKIGDVAYAKSWASGIT
jgi:hypothetical protein